MPILGIGSIPQCMNSELKKAVECLDEFTADSGKGPDTLIPESIFARAKGIAIISYSKMGCFIAARGGSGLVMAKLPDGGWSAPSALGIVGISGGLEFGIEFTAIIMMLMYSNAVKAFMKGKNIALGGGISVAAGPLGRDLEVDVAIKSPAAMYTYAKAKGLFVGINLGGTLVLERRKANEKFYGQGVRAYDILSGKVEAPRECYVLHAILEKRTRAATKKGVKQAVNIGSKAVEKKYGVTGLNKFANKNTDKALDLDKDGKEERGKHGTQSNTRTHSKGKPKFLSKKSSKSVSVKSKPSISRPSVKVNVSKPQHTRPKKGAMPSRPTKGPAPPRPTKGPAPRLLTLTKSAPSRPPAIVNSAAQNTAPQRIWAESLHPYTGQMSCDISFQQGERIEILMQTPSEFDWWEGRIHGKVGIFPANYVRIVS